MAALVLRQPSSVFVSVDQHINATSQCQQIEAQLTKLLEAIKEPVKVTLWDFDPICSDTGRSFKKKKKTWLVSEATFEFPAWWGRPFAATFTPRLRSKSRAISLTLTQAFVCAVNRVRRVTTETGNGR